MHGTNNTEWGDIKVQLVPEHGENYEDQEDRGPNISNNITLTGSTKENVHDLLRAAGLLC